MGPSGSGKTTLLTALAKRLVGSNTVTGAVFINGKPMPGPAFRKISCFVQNDEPFISSLTVSETLHFASRLAGPRSVQTYIEGTDQDYYPSDIFLTA